LVRQIRAVWLVCTEKDGSALELGQVPTDMLDPVQVTLAWSCAEAWQHHGRSCDANVSKTHRPLHGANQGLMLCHTLLVQFIRRAHLGMITLVEREATLCLG
jgi:hypothetical protein